MKKIVLTSTLVMTVIAGAFAQTTWTVDKAHSKVGFSVEHLVISETEGNFKEFDGKIVSQNDDFVNSEIEFEIAVASIDTDIEDRDNHLKSADFFDAAKYKNITFKGKNLKKIDGKNYKLVGNLTIKDVTREVELDVVFNGIVIDPWGNTKAGFKLNGVINRFDYGLKWNTLTEAGGLVVGEEVAIEVKFELAKQG